MVTFFFKSWAAIESISLRAVRSHTMDRINSVFMEVVFGVDIPQVSGDTGRKETEELYRGGMEEWGKQRTWCMREQRAWNTGRKTCDEARNQGGRWFPECHRKAQSTSFWYSIFVFLFLNSVTEFQSEITVNHVSFFTIQSKGNTSSAGCCVLSMITHNAASPTSHFSIVLFSAAFFFTSMSLWNSTQPTVF